MSCDVFFVCVNMRQVHIHFHVIYVYICMNMGVMEVWRLEPMVTYYTYSIQGTKSNLRLLHSSIGIDSIWHHLLSRGGQINTNNLLRLVWNQNMGLIVKKRKDNTKTTTRAKKSRRINKWEMLKGPDRVARAFENVKSSMPHLKI